MENKRTEMARNYYRRYRQRQFWKRLVSIMGCFVVFCTTYALILPAITLDEGTICGMREHQHTSDCYIMPESGHVHTDACYTETVTYICGMEEAEEESGFFETLFGDESSTSSAIEYEPAEPVHSHTDACMEITAELTCGLEETVPHSHDDTCFDENGELICELPTELEEPLLICDITPHIHSDGCFPSEKQEEQTKQNEITASEEQKLICTMTVHQHEEECYDAVGNLFCTVEEHEHSENCFLIEEKPTDSNETEDTEKNKEPDERETICGMIAHRHEESCYDTDENLICGIEEHEHGERCYPEEKLIFQILCAAIYTDASYTILLEDTEEEMQEIADIRISGRLPVDIQVKAYPVMMEQPDKEVVCAYDITLYREDGSVYEPTGDENITVAIQTPELYNENQDAGQSMEVYYVPEEGDPERVESVMTDEGISFDTTHFSVYMVTRNGSATLTVNTVKDAFLKDPAYELYYNSNSPIGTAGSFHIVAFEDARLQTHTNGNVLAKNLYANSNFGTNGYEHELSYVQNYMQVNGNSASKNEHILVLGSANTVTSTDNGNAFNIRGPSMTYDQKLDRPKHVIQDADTDVAPFIDLVRVEEEVRQIASKLSAKENANITYPKESDQYSVMKLTKPSGVGVVNLTASELDALGGHGNTIRMTGFTDGANGTIVINVDCTGVSEIWMPSAPIYVDGNMVSMNETVDFSAGKVIWNFENAENVTINTYLMTGMIVAPGANVNIKQNLNGTVVAENIKVEAESHRTDFTGTIVEPEPEKQPHQITIQKHETGYVANTLPGAAFKLFEYDSTQNTWVQINDDNIKSIEILRTDTSGLIHLSGLKTSVAYKLEEITAPAGYMPLGKPFYFWIKAASTDTAPPEPENFSGSMISPGNTLFIPNDKNDSETTSLLLKKLWKLSDGTDIPETDIPVSEIEMDIYQLVNGNRTDTVYQTVIVSATNNWAATIDNLPIEGKDANGNKVAYAYEVEENFSQDGYTVTCEINGTTITVTNTKTVNSYILPETGGIGIIPCMTAGMLLTGVTGFLLIFRKRNRGKEEKSSY